MKRQLAIALSAALAIGLELAAAAYPFLSQSGPRLLPALSFHVAAVVACVIAARLRRAPERLLPAELDAVLITAIFVPLAGPVLGWVIPRRSNRDSVVDAHEAFQQREVVHGTGGPHRTLFTGRFDEDLATMTDAMTYAEVLRDGCVAEKRSAIKKLCASRAPQHLARVRATLSDSDDEVRLFAYAELTRIEREYEDALAELGERVFGDEDQAVVRIDLAVKHLDYARSGVLDADFARFHTGRAIERAEEAYELGADGPSCARAGLLARLDMGQVGDAEEWLERFSEAVVAHPTVRLAEAELAFACRDLERARSIARELGSGESAPRWLSALLAPERPGPRRHIRGRRRVA